MKWLNYKGVKTLRINGDEELLKFVKISEEGIFFKNALSGNLINLNEIQSCWWRRTGLTKKNITNENIKPGTVFSGLDFSRFITDKRNFLEDESKNLIDYIFYRVFSKASINLGRPNSNLNRLIVLDIAKSHGLMVPDYNVVSNTSELASRNGNLSKSVSKSIANGIYNDIDNHRFYTYTELIEEKFYTENEKVEIFPSLITQLIEKKMEIRTFYIDGSFYSMAIFSQSNEKTKIDFRKYSNNRTEPYKLPLDIEHKLKLVFKQLDLNCGSVDLIIDNQDNFIFLEINPVGQFAMTSEPCNYNLHKIVANYLEYGRN